jgi:two-component system chemotaxis sensor kinase CheA
MNDDELARLLLSTFVDEAREQLQRIGSHLMELESGTAGPENAERVQDAFRDAHNLKGAARAVAAGDIEHQAHELETFFAALREAPDTLDRPSFDGAHGLLRQSEQAVEVLAGASVDETTSSPSADAPVEVAPPPDTIPVATGPPRWVVSADASAPAGPSPAEAPRPPRSGVDETIRVATGKLDALMAQVGELVAARSSAEQRLREVDGLLAELSELAPSRPELGPVLHGLEGLRHGFAADSRRIAQLTTDLRDGVHRTRMLPVATILDALPRAARDLASELGKAVTVELHGSETEVDRSVLDQLRAPLMHMLRNCLDHGLEPPEARERAGKPRSGTVTLRARHSGPELLLTVADDGRGLDAGRLCDVAVERGVVSSAEAARLSERDAWQLIFRSGFSTREEVSDLSGRGVGMDVVREHVERLQGQVEVESVAGAGTRFTLRVPLSIASTSCLLVQAGDQVYALPLTGVIQLLSLPPHEIHAAQGRSVISVDGAPIALSDLTEALGIPLTGEARSPGARAAVVLGGDDRRAALVIDHPVGSEELVVKPLSPPLDRGPHVTGAAIRANGDVVMVLNAAELASAGRRSRAPVAPADVDGTRVPESSGQRVLVVDDSLTIRTLEKNLLQAAGYSVDAACDGHQAWERLQRGGVDLVLSDIEMPHMDGIELVSRVRADEVMRDLPFVLVSSLGSEADQARGLAAGADAYIVKDAGPQDRLLETVQRLV